MTTSQLTHLSLSVLSGLLSFALAYFLFRCPEVTDTLPRIQDETAIRIQVQREIRAREVRPLQNDLKAAIFKLDSLAKLPPRIKYRYHEQAVTNWNLSDSLSGVLLVGRIRERIETVNQER